MRKFIHVHASPYLFEKKVSLCSTVIKPDRNQLVYSKNGHYNFHRSKRWPSGQGLGLGGRGFDPYSGRHEHCVLEQDILLGARGGVITRVCFPDELITKQRS